MVETHISMCKVCPAYCPIEVTVENGRAIKVIGDRNSPLYKGYTCPKGRKVTSASPTAALPPLQPPRPSTKSAPSSRPSLSNTARNP